MTINEKLLAIQTELNAPKNQKNTFGGYYYRSCEDILEAVKPFLKKYKVTLILSDSMKEVGNRIYVEATVRLIDIETQEFIFNTAYAREEESKKGMDGSQVTGAASSYARKYALNGLFCIDDNKDSDKTNVADNDTEEEPKAKPKKVEIPKGLQFDAGEVTKAQLDEIKKLVPSLDGMVTYLGIPSIEMLGKEQAQAIIDAKKGK